MDNLLRHRLRTVLLAALLIPLYSPLLFAGEVLLAWTPPTTNVDGSPLNDLAGFMIYYGAYPGNYTRSIDLPDPGATNYTVTNLTDGGTYFFAVTAYDTSGNESDYSNEVGKTASIGGSVTYTEEWGNTPNSDHPNTVEDTSINISYANTSWLPLLTVFTWPADSAASAIVMKWDLSAMPAGAAVVNATLSLYSIGSPSGGDPKYDVSVHKIINKDPVIFQATGYTCDGVEDWTSYIGLYHDIPLAQSDIAPEEDVKSIDNTEGYTSWDVTGIVQEWISDPAKNYGLLLNADRLATAYSNRQFASSEYPISEYRPRLVITFSLNVP